MGWSTTSEHESTAIMHLAKSDDHTAAIMAAAIIEARLRQALEQQFQRNDKVEQEMFRSTGPLGSFSAKIKLAFLMGIINEETYRDLNTIKEVRNRFAHLVEVTHFDSSNIKSLTDRLSLIGKHFEDLREPGQNFANLHKKDLMMNMEGLAEKLTIPRWRYLMTAMLLTTALLFPQGDKPMVR